MLAGYSVARLNLGKMYTITQNGNIEISTTKSPSSHLPRISSGCEGRNIGSGGHSSSHIPSLWAHVTHTEPGSSVPMHPQPHHPAVRTPCTIWVQMTAQKLEIPGPEQFTGIENRKEQGRAVSLGDGCVYSSAR